MLRALHVTCLLVFLPASVHSQTNQEPATVTFTLDFPGSQPGHYSVQVQADGKARYESSGRPIPESQESDNFDYEFAISPATLELGHRLEYSLRYQKLALAEDLKRTEDSARLSPPVEIQAIAPILQQIIADSTVMNVTRARARRLLERPAGR